MEKKYNILIVEDDNFLVDMYALKFSQSGYKVSTAPSAEQAVKMLKEGLAPDVMLVDIVMPEVNGFEFLEQMKNEKLAPHAVKIVLSNRGEQSDIEKGNSLGISGYIVKANTTPSEVIAKVDEIVEKKSKKE